MPGSTQKVCSPYCTSTPTVAPPNSFSTWPITSPTPAYGRRPASPLPMPHCASPKPTACGRAAPWPAGYHLAAQRCADRQLGRRHLYDLCDPRQPPRTACGCPGGGRLEPLPEAGSGAKSLWYLARLRFIIRAEKRAKLRRPACVSLACSVYWLSWLESAPHRTQTFPWARSIWSPRVRHYLPVPLRRRRFLWTRLFLASHLCPKSGRPSKISPTLRILIFGTRPIYSQSITATNRLASSRLRRPNRRASCRRASPTSV